MLDRINLHDYQNRAVSFVKEKKKCGLFLDMGLGKTTSSLTATSELMQEGKVNRALIIAPLRVTRTVWAQEAEKWKHLEHLTFSEITGNKESRINALKTKADIYLTNRENVKWLVDLCIKKKKFPWDCVIIDESSSFKSSKAQRFKALCKVLGKVNYMVLLTGTPAPNGIMDLWSQIYLIDGGKRLGSRITEFKSKYFTPSGYMGYTMEMINGADTMVRDKIQDVCLSMEAKDYLDMPKRIDISIPCEMSREASEKYDEMLEEFILKLEDGEIIEAKNAASKAGKLLQLCNGAIYNEEKDYHVTHDAKIEAIKDIMEDNAGENILVAYNFKSDLERLQAAFPEAVTLDPKGKCVNDWNAGKIKMLLAHPASAGHGLNLQKGGSMIVWFGMNWSLELYQQFNGRLYRQGQTKPVRIVHLISNLDDGGKAIDAHVLSAVEGKAQRQDQLIQYLKENLREKV